MKIGLIYDTVTLPNGQVRKVRARIGPIKLPDLTMRQFRLGLLNAGLLDGVSAAIDALPEPDRTAAKIEYEYAGSVVRTDPWVKSLATAMDLPDDQVDDLWEWAASL